MTSKPTKKKLCWHCEGRVALQDENCPYCGVSLASISNGLNKGNDSLFSPPYRMETVKDAQQVPPSPYQAEEIVSVASEPIPEAEPKAYSLALNNLRENVLPSLLLSAGLIFILFSFVLFLFSHKGLFTLQWNSTYWYVYLFAGLGALGYGWNTIQSLPEDQ